MEAVPTPSKDSPSMVQAAPEDIQKPTEDIQKPTEGVQKPPSATDDPGIQRPIPTNNNESHSLRRRNSRADLREEYEQDRPSSKCCNPC